jgi:hypothetical protein
MLPDFLIIGAQKSATTYVQARLREHPDVFIPPGEVPFFESPDYDQQPIGALEQIYAQAGSVQARGLKRPNYLHKPECPERIYRHMPDAKLIVVLRDYIDRTISAYYHQAWYGFAPIKDINEGLPEVIQGKHQKRYPRAKEIIDFGYYYEHLQRYLQWFSRDQLLIVLQEDLHREPLETLYQIQRFVGVREYHQPESLTRSANVTTYSLVRIQMRRLMNPLAFTYSPDRMRLHKRTSMNWLQRATYGVLNRFDRRVLARIFRGDKPALNADVQAMLSHLYTEDALLLEQLLGRSLRHWKVFQAPPTTP